MGVAMQSILSFQGTQQNMYLHKHMLLPFIFHPHVLDLEGSISKRQVFEVDLLDQARRLVLIHQGLHSFLHSILKAIALHLEQTYATASRNASYDCLSSVALIV